MIASVAFRFRTLTESIGGSGLQDQGKNPSPHASARRSFCHLHDISLGEDAKATFSSNADDEKNSGLRNTVRVRVAGFPSTNANCAHRLFAEHGPYLKKLDLPATRRVEVRQKFHAEAGYFLHFDSVVTLRPGRAVGSAKVHAVVVNLSTQQIDVLLHRTSDCGKLTASRGKNDKLRETFSLPILDAGEYELRTNTSVEPTCTDAMAHLLISSVRVTDSQGNEVKRLASLICVGRVSA